MKTNLTFFEQLRKEIKHLSISDNTKKIIEENLNSLESNQLHLMIVGATGSGKSSTINALFNINGAKVGNGCAPKTASITSYTLNNIVLWDCPGLGDGVDEDKQHAAAIKDKLLEHNSKGGLLIDLVLVIIDGSNRDLSTSIKLINEVTIPYLGKNPDSRLIVAINQADVALKGLERWNHKSNTPTKEAEKFLNDKVKSIEQRIFKSTGVNINPIYYVAGYQSSTYHQQPYNLSKLLYLIIQQTPKYKRSLLSNNDITENSSTLNKNDNLLNYNQINNESLWEAILSSTTQGVYWGEDIGSLLGNNGMRFGKIIGGSIGAIIGSLSYLLSNKLY